MDDMDSSTISAADITSRIESQPSNPRQYNNDESFMPTIFQDILNVLFTKADGSSGKSTPVALSGKLLVELEGRLKELALSGQIQSEQVQDGVDELKGAGIICSAKCSNGELSESLSPKTLEDLKAFESMREKIRNENEALSPKKVRAFACQSFVQKWLDKRSDVEGNLTSVAEGTMVNVEGSPAAEKEAVVDAIAGPSFLAGSSRQSHANRQASALVTPLGSKLVTERRKPSPDLQHCHDRQASLVHLPSAKKRAASPRVGSSPSPKRPRPSPFLVSPSAAPGLRVPAGTSTSRECASRNVDRVSSAVLPRGSLPFSGCDSSALSSPIHPKEQPSNSVNSNPRSEINQKTQIHGIDPAVGRTEQSQVQLDNSSMPGQSTNQRATNSLSPANNESQQKGKGKACASDNTRALSTEAAKPHVPDAPLTQEESPSSPKENQSSRDSSEYEDPAKLLVKLIQAERPSSIMSSYSNVSVTHSTAYKLLCQMEKDMNKDHESIQGLEAETQQRHSSYAGPESSRDAVESSSQQRAWQRIISDWQNRREISDIQITQELSSFLFKDALWSFNLNPNENRKAIGDVTQVTESCLSVLKSQMGSVQTLVKKVIPIGIRYLNANQQDGGHSGNSPEASAANRQLILIQREFQQLGQQIGHILKHPESSDFTNASSSREPMRINEEVRDVNRLIGHEPESIGSINGPAPEEDGTSSEEGQSSVASGSTIRQSFRNRDLDEPEAVIRRLNAQVEQLTRRLHDQETNIMRTMFQLTSIISDFRENQS
ncbi:hypothetical protein PCANC_00189 [Puccinia coronata f. sp. avenae]|uniref:Uncharacterized protein n=1 Tax=Puccinia coronata f. sp. avenae TaxID=200324 RepID=A0A2N5W8I9_9BASI|nr:hypothetical protein PCANC_00189 [Puccinia coronata f. sp. avenae]